MIKIGIIGCGYWGPNLIRNFIQLPSSHVVYACDLDEGRLNYIKKLYPHIKVTKDSNELYRDENLDVIGIATPVSTHYYLAREALKHDKHIFIEKPMTANSREAEEIVALAAERKRVLMVDHTFEYVVAVNKIREVIANGELGDIYYINMSRLNLGLFQTDINVIWDLAPHDLSIAMYILNDRPVSISAFGNSCVVDGIEDVALLKLEFPGNILVIMNLSWLDPCKVRRTTIVGSKKMLLYDDVEQMEKIKIYDKSVQGPRYYDNFGEFQFSYHYGDVIIPRIDSVEPLKLGCSHFIECIEKGLTPRSDGIDGLNVVKILEAAQRSLRNGGTKERIERNAIQ
jgi:predicted dehydrogenase